MSSAGTETASAGSHLRVSDNLGRPIVKWAFDDASICKGAHCPVRWFSYENLSLVSFDFLLWRLVARSDHGQTPEQQSESENLRIAAFLMAKNAKTEMTSYEEMYKQMVLCRGVDMYLTYLTELLRLVFSVKPEIMKSNEQVTYEFILEHSTIDDLGRLAHRGEGHKALTSWCREVCLSSLKKGLGLALFTNPACAEGVAKLVEIRNIIVHNRGIVNQLFLDRVPGWLGKIGEAIVVRDKEITKMLVFLAAAAGDTDERARDKFGLPTYDITSFSSSAAPRPTEPSSGA